MAASTGDALTNCNGLADDSCGLSDGSIAGEWRLPSIRELLSLLDFQRYNKALPFNHPFENVDVVYWSSTTSVSATGYAFTVNFTGGILTTVSKGSSVNVWPVRGGQ